MRTALQTKLSNTNARWTTILGRITTRQSTRDRNILRHTLLSSSYKGLSVLLALAVVPLSINYLDTERYGIWITLSSILSWINLMDIGLGNGLRNKLVKALTEHDEAYGQTLISTTYALVIGIVLVVAVVVSGVLPQLNLQHIFNSHTISQAELTASVVVSFLAFCLLFVLKPLTALIMATQRASFDNLLLLLGNGLGILGICVLNYVHAGHGNLLELVTVFSLAPPVAYLLGSIYLYRRLPALKPSIRAVNLREAKTLFNQSAQFFVIQIAAAVVFTSNSIILSQLFGNETVTTYNVVFRYFSLVMMVQTIVLTPIWSAVTEAYQKQDFGWIRSTIQRLVKNSLLLGGVVGLQIVAAPLVFRYWLGPDFPIDHSLLLAVAFYTVLMLAGSTFTYVINGVGTIRLQTITALCTSLFGIPTALYFGQQYGAVGVVLANCIWPLLFLPLRIMQCHYIVTNTLTNIWAK